MHCGYADPYFSDTPKHRGHDLALWFFSHAFKKQDCHEEKFQMLVRDIESAHPGFILSPIVGLTFFRCIHMNRKDVILGLIAEGADVNMMFRGRCMLHEAVKVSNEEMLKFLLSIKNIDKDVCDVECKTPLMEAACGRPKCLRILLEANCDMLLTDSHGDTALHQTFTATQARQGDILACLDLLLEFGADINSVGAEGKTCLQKAVEMSSYWLVKWLILHNCDLHVRVRNSRYNLAVTGYKAQQDETPLIIAFIKADRVMVEVLIGCGCSFRHYRWILEYCKPYVLLHKYLVGAFLRVDSLQSMCRRKVRECLTTNIVAECQVLGLPSSIQKFILCQEELNALNNFE